MRKDYWWEIECEFCLTICKIRRADMAKADSTAEVICKECIGEMLARYRKTGILSAP